MPPGARTGESGTTVHSSVRQTVPRAAESQNNTRHDDDSAMTAETGSPIAPPTPSVALITAMAVPTRSAGRMSRMMLMPSGMTPIAQPCSPRPMTIGSSDPASAATTEPAMSTTTLASRILRLP
jgi:hypothetical protein